MPAVNRVPRRFTGHLAAVLACAGLAAALWSAPATAAPQVLGLVADNGFPTPLSCDGYECSAQFSSFCLQEGRASPSTGTAYVAGPEGEITLVASTPDGRELRLPAEGTLRIATMIGFTSVAMSVPQSEHDRIAESLGVAPQTLRLAVAVSPSVSLVPAPVANDPDPQTDAELALAVGPLRDLAETLFEAPGASADAARIATLLINSLPPRGRETPEDRNALFDRVAALPAVGALTPQGVERAHALFAECRISVESSSMFSMRECLRLRHADLMVNTNRKFWTAAGGS